MRKLGHKGRFANQLFQYAYLRQEALVNYGGEYQWPQWVGQLLFKIDDPVPSKEAKELSYKFPKHSTYYNKKLFKLLFRPKKNLHLLIDDAIRSKARGKTLVGLHLRRGDYGTFKRKSARWCFVAPTEWYLDLLKNLQINNPLLFIASEDSKELVKDFSEYETFSWDRSFYWDFYTLTQCDYMMISNSTFGFAASMLNERATQFYRPRLSKKRLIPYDPWNAPLVYKDERY